jgi:ABC-2 type transport system ATP-binding protein
MTQSKSAPAPDDAPASDAPASDDSPVGGVAPYDTLDDTQEGAPSGGGDSVLVFEAASRWHGDVIALNDVSLRIAPGITGLLGPNGAGKSTMMKLAAGLLRPSQGRVRLLGEDPWDNHKLLARLGYVPEGPAPWRDLTGHACVAKAARLTGLGRADADAAARGALERVGLTDAADKVVETYSHGMQQRLKFALATVHDPDVLLLDEPLLGTDPLARRHLIAFLKRLADEGKSILLSTHVLTDVEALTDRIALLHHGRLMAHGDVHEIRDLLDRYPRSVRVTTDDPRALGQAVWKWPEVLSVEADDRSVTFRTSAPRAFYGRLQTLLTEGTHPFTSITSPDDTVEAVFRYLVR